MPCGYFNPLRRDDECDSETLSLKIRLVKRQKELDVLTRILCAIVGRLSSKGQFAMLLSIKGFRTWWKKHQEVDKERTAREKEKKDKDRLRSSALKKLSPEERKALNL